MAGRGDTRERLTALMTRSSWWLVARVLAAVIAVAVVLLDPIAVGSFDAPEFVRRSLEIDLLAVGVLVLVTWTWVRKVDD